ncbi:MAG TPA: RNA-binding protein [Stellaceae bacterium]|nr:RNA-binding protein [Stellaceae bacterium]
MGDTPSRAGHGAEAGESGPQRRCLVTGDIRDRSDLVRFVVGPGGEIVPDVAARLPGRGLWLTPRRDIVERALAKRLFARAARRPVAAPAGLADRLEAALAQRCIDAIGLARRAGLAVVGFERVSETVRGGKAAALLAAIDGAEGGRRKLQALGRGLPLACVLTAAEIGAAFGREHGVNASLGSGPLCRRFLSDAQKLAGFRANAVVEQALKSVPAAPARPDDGIGVK